MPSWFCCPHSLSISSVRNKCKDTCYVRRRKSWWRYTVWLKESTSTCWTFSTHAEIAVTWDDDDLGEYSRKRHGVCDSLQLLKEYVHTPLQKSHIDSLCLLLWNKELLFIQGGTYLQGTAGHRWHCTRKHSCHCLDSPETGCTAKGKYGFSGSRCGRCNPKRKGVSGYLP